MVIKIPDVDVLKKYPALTKTRTANKIKHRTMLMSVRFLMSVEFAVSTELILIKLMAMIIPAK